jgi:lysozyme
MTATRQAVLAAMGFQLGIAGLLAFKATLRAMEAGSYAMAAAGMLASKWASQTPARAQRMAAIMREG